MVDSTHGAATGYQVQYRTSAGPGSWQTTGVAIAGTQGVVTGLAASTGYDFEVQATNSGPTPSGWTSPASTTTASAGNYLLTSAPGTGGLTWAGGVALSTTNTSIAVNANDNTTLADGSHTAPGNVYFGWSASNTVAPTSLLAASGQTTGIPGSGGSNLWYQWVAAPTTAGSYYFWAVAKNSTSGGSVVRTLVSTAAFTVS